MFNVQRFGYAGRGFSLMEVILAIGVLSVAIVSLLGLLGPLITSVEEVMQRNAAIGVITKVNTFFQASAATIEPIDQHSPTITLPPSEQATFSNVSQWARDGRVLYAWNKRQSTGPLALKIGHDVAVVRNDFHQDDIHIEGSVFVVVLSRAGLDLNYPYSINTTEGYVPVKISIYAVDTAVVTNTALFDPVVSSDGLDEQASTGISAANLLIAYTAAKVR